MRKREQMTDEEILAYNREVCKQLPDENIDDRHEHTAYQFWMTKGEPEMAAPHKAGYDRYEEWLKIERDAKSRILPLSKKGQKKLDKETKRVMKQIDKEISEELEAEFGKGFDLDHLEYLVGDILQ